MQRTMKLSVWVIALAGVAGVFFFLDQSRQPVVSVASEDTAAFATGAEGDSRQVSGPSDGFTEASEETGAGIDLGTVPGASIVQAQLVINDSPIGAEGVAGILADGSGTEFERGERLARITLNTAEDDEVRQEALEQWLKMIPEEGNSLLGILAADARLDDGMKIMLLKDADTRGKGVQVRIAYQMFGIASEEVATVSRAVLADILGKDYGSNKSDWSLAVGAFLAARGG